MKKLHHFPTQPLAFELLKIGLFKFPPRQARIVFKCCTQLFFVKGKISDGDFLHIDQTLKPRPSGLFLLSHLLAKLN